ncbi:hypothetical protein A7K91_11415 [Paenibacillus oryzae]|uniref:DUF445 domain-containing protein n=1 Tax=Paenibacillus oryzae TaxID=1844972 RepID=A0A1A5YED0_9BACL|nr:DUF445 domain-containing protein [Paenibacillus oryzae]OBR63996.1 hypothetical protein A7K91_11415 [Paenibacillus oryzae]
MGKRDIRTTANGILVLSGAGILAAFPFQQHFAGGLLFAGFSAATIGGLADSFAISALFGNPLRIKWPSWMGTRIIARRREKLIGELADMVEKELLTVDHIKMTLKDYNLGDTIARYLTRHGGAEDVKAIATKLAAELLGKADPGELATGMRRFLLDHADALQASDLLADIGEWSIKNGYDEKAVSFAAAQLAGLAGSEKVRLLIQQFAEAAVKSYEGDKLRRRLVDFTAGLNAYAISVKVQNWLVAFLEGMASPDHPASLALKEQLAGFVERLRNEVELRQEVERIKSKLLQGAGDSLRLDQFIASRLEKAREKLLAANGDASQGWIAEQISRGVAKLSESAELRKTVDSEIKHVLLAWLERHHTVIGKLVREKLNAFSEEELSDFVKDKAGKDLQYIRLNGMVVGAFVGMGLYLLTFWIGGARA